MILDASHVPDGALLEREVCVVGAGAAGITLALELAGASPRVLVLESGGFEPEPATQDLYRGRIFGRSYRPLHETRTRSFGGSTHCWLGLSRRLDALDFEPRDWVPHSGWPFGRAALDPYYERAQRICQLEDASEPGERRDGAELPRLPLASDAIVTRGLQIAPTRFGEVYRSAVAAARNVETVLHANAVELVANPEGTLLERVRVATLARTGFEVRARVFVLATGGIENARLLLASNRVAAEGLGNGAGLVGRFFMEHPQLAAGAFLPARAELPLDLYQARARGRVQDLAVLAPSDALLRRERLQDFVAVLAGEGALPDFERSLARTVHELDAAPGEVAPQAFFLLNSCEQAPNPQSRVRLSEERDALGMPRVQLEWRLSPSDLRSLRRGHEILARELGRAGIGRLQLMLGENEMDWPDDLSGSSHHMGTTRMHPDPRQGVVDASGRVHGIANLYIAGSSVFPTSGAASPTLTIVALAIRLADRLKAVLA